MGLPNAELAVVEREKITEYLLNPEHPDNGGKAVFFPRARIQLQRLENVANALQRSALAADVTDSMETVHGKK